jgi:hypothetical protein
MEERDPIPSQPDGSSATGRSTLEDGIHRVLDAYEAHDRQRRRERRNFILTVVATLVAASVLTVTIWQAWLTRNAVYEARRAADAAIEQAKISANSSEQSAHDTAKSLEYTRQALELSRRSAESEHRAWLLPAKELGPEHIRIVPGTELKFG